MTIGDKMALAVSLLDLVIAKSKELREAGVSKFEIPGTLSLELELADLAPPRESVESQLKVTEPDSESADPMNDVLTYGRISGGIPGFKKPSPRDDD
jgi:hypothetical protein